MRDGQPVGVPRPPPEAALGAQRGGRGNGAFSCPPGVCSSQGFGDTRLSFRLVCCNQWPVRFAGTKRALAHGAAPGVWQ